MADINAALAAAQSAIDDLCAPARMTKAEAVDFLEGVISQCEMSVEALKDEIRSEGGGSDG